MYDVLDEIPENPDEAVLYLVEELENTYTHYFSAVTNGKRKLNVTNIFDLQTHLTLLRQAVRASSMGDQAAEITDMYWDDVELGEHQVEFFYGYFGKLKSLVLSHKFEKKLELSIEYSFSVPQDDKDKIYALTAEMRVTIHQSSFDQGHKNRLLKRINRIDIEVGKPKGSWDVFLARAQEFGQYTGEFGKDIKPLVDRLNEIMKIVRPHSKNEPLLPAPEEQKRLPSPKKEEE